MYDMQINLRCFSFSVLVLFLFLPSAAAKNGKLFIDFSLASKHIDAGNEYNEINPGIGLSYFAGKNWEMRGGYYNNSYERPAFYLTANYVPVSADLKNFNFKPGIAAGFATGYKDGELLVFGKSPILCESVVPVLAPNISVLFRPANARFVLLMLGNALALQVSYLI